MFPSLYIVAKCKSCPANWVDDPPPSLLIKPSAPTVLQLHSTNNMFPWFAAGFRSPVWPVTKGSAHRMSKVTAAKTNQIPLSTPLHPTTLLETHTISSLLIDTSFS
jgi:hypothetical protein